MASAEFNPINGPRLQPCNGKERLFGEPAPSKDRRIEAEFGVTKIYKN
jgi:hypothetical protein